MTCDFPGGGGGGVRTPPLDPHLRLAGVRQWSDFVCLFGLKLLGAQKNRLTAVNNFPC